VAPKKPQPPVGLPNKGNTCYANAILQAFSVIPQYWSIPPANTPLLRTLQDALSRMSFKKQSFVDPLPFLRSLEYSIHRDKPTFPYNHQQDSQEILEHVLNAIGKESLQACQKVSSQVITTTTCNECFAFSSSQTTSNIVVLNSNKHLAESIKQFTSTETLLGPNKWFCHACGRNQEASKNSFFTLAPDILIISLRRYRESPIAKGSFVKDTTKTNILEPLVIPISDNEQEVHLNQSYTLVASIDHIGTLTSGHYLAHVKHGNVWFRCNDRAISRVCSSNLINTSSYILFYTKD